MGQPLFMLDMKDRIPTDRIVLADLCSCRLYSEFYCMVNVDRSRPGLYLADTPEETSCSLYIPKHHDFTWDEIIMKKSMDRLTDKGIGLYLGLEKVGRHIVESMESLIEKDMIGIEMLAVPDRRFKNLDLFFSYKGRYAPIRKLNRFIF